MTIFTHIVVGTNALEKSRAFYDAAMAEIGLKRLSDLGVRGSGWGKEEPLFWVMTPKNGKAATFGNGVTVSFDAPNRAAIDNFHRVALANGGQDEGAPGPRDATEHAYAAYVRDPDGNKLAVFCFKPE